MKQIQWYPGHMFKSFREIKEKLKLMDMMYVLIDARIPISSMNPEVLKVVGEKPTLLLFNKMDLADRHKVKLFEKYYRSLGFYTLGLNSQTGENVNKIYELSREILKDKIESALKKGMKFKVIRGMILGIPNVGKSTLINQMVKKKVAQVGNKPGVTKAQQWIKINPSFELLDTPGVLWPKFDEKVGYNLALTGAIKDDILPLNQIVSYALAYLKTAYPARLAKRYNIESIENMTTHEILEHIGHVRKAYVKGGLLDYERIYKIVLTDVRSKQLGAIVFDEANF